MPISFLQISDTHLGARLGSLPEDKANELRQNCKSILEAAFALVKERQLELVLMPGDLFEEAGHDPASQLRFIYSLASSIAPVPVVIAPGNHDAYGPESPYATVEAPSNVVLFTRGGFEVKDTPVGRITGRAVTASAPYGDLNLAELPTPPPPPGILVMHASVLGAEDNRPHPHTVGKTTSESLMNTGYAYIALGHYHNSTLWNKPGEERAFTAYAGCPQGLGWDEPGMKGYLIGQLGDSGASLELIESSLRRWHRQTLALPPEYAADFAPRLSAAIDEITKAINPNDLLALKVMGRCEKERREWLLDKIAAMKAHAWHLREVDMSSVEWLDELPQEGDSMALDMLLERCRKGVEAGGEDEAAWRLASYLGRRLMAGTGLPLEVAL